MVRASLTGLTGEPAGCLHTTTGSNGNSFGKETTAMSDMHTPGTPGQVTDPSTATPAQNDVAELLRLMELNVRSITRMSAVLVKLSDRSDLIERRLTSLEGDASDDEGAPSTERRRLDAPPRLALRHDTRVLLEITSDLPEAALEGREVGRYLTLSEAESCDVIDRTDGGFADAAARASWQVARRAK